MPTIFKKTLQGSRFWAVGTLTFFILLAWTVVPARNVGFSSDDFVHLVEDSQLPWYMSSDHLNRPLRNGLFRLFASFFGLQPEPYRCIAFVFYCATGLLLYRFVRQLGASRGAAFVASVLFAFFPRNHESLFWFAAFQDVVVSTCILLACIIWLSYLRRGGLWRFLAVHLVYVTALGFKETSIGLPAILLCLDIAMCGFATWRESLASHLRRYWLFLPLVAGFCIYIFLFGSFHESSGIYAGTTMFGVVLPLMRTFVNLILQFSSPITLRDITTRQLTLVAVGCAVISLAIWKTRDQRWAFLGLCWFLIFALPTAAFARSVNVDRYLMLPYMGLLLIATGIADRIERVDGWLGNLLCASLLVYAVAGSHRLVHFREAYRQAALEIQYLGDTAAELIYLRSLSPRTELTLANLIHSREVSVLNNGVRGVLIRKGLPREVPVLYNFASNSAEQAGLIKTLKSCGHDPLRDSKAPVLLLSKGQLTDVSSACTEEAIQSDRRGRLDGWFESPRGFSSLQ